MKNPLAFLVFEFLVWSSDWIKTWRLSLFFFLLLMSNVILTCQSLVGTGKMGTLKPDADGYYSQPVGAIGCYNSAGHFYTAEDVVKQLFQPGSMFYKRVERGVVRGEIDHPEWPAGMSAKEYEQRMLVIDPKNTCVHFSKFELDDKNYKDREGRPIVVIIGHFTPSGVKGEFLAKQLQNKRENVCFSIRAFTEDRYIGAVRHRRLLEIVTFDYVNEGGIYEAQKYKSLTLESHKEVSVTPRSLSDALDRQVVHFGRESITMNKDDLFKSLGWNKMEKTQSGWASAF